MNAKLKYLSVCVNIILIHVSTNSSYVIAEYEDKLSSGNVRMKRQAGYVYDKPNVSFDLPTVPTAPSIATTQAPTVDRAHMQMYYAYPMPASGGGTVQTSGYSTGSASAETSGVSGYNYGTRNSASNSGGTGTAASGYNYSPRNAGSLTNSATAGSSSANSGYNYNTRSTVSATSSTAAGLGAGSGYNYGSRNSGSSSSSAAEGSSGVTGYNYGVTNKQVTATRTKLTESGYQNAAPVATQSVVSTGSTGYGPGRPTSTSGGSVSTSAPRYLPPKISGESNAAVSYASNQATPGSPVAKPSESYIPQTVQISPSKVENPTESYIPPTVQGSSPKLEKPSESYIPPTNEQTVTKTQSEANTVSSSNPVSVPNAGYLQPAAGPQSKSVQSVVNVPTQQYLPPNESPATVERPATVNAPAATYLPPAF